MKRLFTSSSPLPCLAAMRMHADNDLLPGGNSASVDANGLAVEQNTKQPVLPCIMRNCVALRRDQPVRMDNLVCRPWCVWNAFVVNGVRVTIRVGSSAGPVRPPS